MKISELIAELEKMLKEHGDVPVLRWDDCWYANVEGLTYYQADDKDEGCIEID